MGIKDLNSSISGAIKSNPILQSAMGTISAALQAGATKASLESGTFYDKHAAHSAVLGPGQEEVITETRGNKTEKRTFTSTAGNVRNGYMGLTILPISYPVGGLKQLMGANYATVRGVVEELPSIALTSEWKSTDDIGGFASDVIYEAVKEIPLVGSAVSLAEQFASVARNELIRVGGVAGGYQRKKRYWTHTGPISFQIKFKSVDFNGTGEPMRVMAKLFSYAVPVTPTNDASADDIFQALLAVVTICASVGADIATAGMTVLEELGDLVPKGVKDLLSTGGGAILKGLSSIVSFGGGIASGKTSADLKASAKVDEAEAAKAAAEITSEKPVTNLSKEQQDAYDAYVKTAKGKKGNGTPKSALEWWTVKMKNQATAGVKNGLAEVTDVAAATGTLVGSVVGGAARIAGGVGKVFTSAIGSDDLRQNSMNLMANGIYSALYNWAQEMQDATTLRYAPPTVRVIIGDFFDNDDMIITSVSEQPSKEQTRNGPLWIEFTIQVESRGDIDGFERIGLQVNSGTALETARRLGIAEGKGGEWGEMLDMAAYKKNYGTGINVGDNHRPTNSTNYYYDGSQRGGQIGTNGGHGDGHKTGIGNR